MEKEIRKTT